MKKGLFYYISLVISALALLASCIFCYISGSAFFLEPNIEGNKVYFISMLLLVLFFTISTITILAITIQKDSREKINDLNIRLKKWTEISYHINKAGDEVFNSLPIGILIYDIDYMSSWANQYIDDIFHIKLSENPIRLDKLIESIYKNVLEDRKSVV